MSLQENLKSTPPSEEVELQNNIFVVENFLHQGQGKAEVFFGVVEYNFHL